MNIIRGFKQMVSGQSELEITDEEFKDTINNSKIAVIDFFAEWCMPCLILGPIIEDLSLSMKRVKFAKIDIDDNQELAEKYKIYSIPCLIIFKDGKEIDRIIGVQPAESIEAKIKSYI